MAMISQNQAKLEEYLLLQQQYPDSPLSLYWQNYSLNWILEHLSSEQKKEFLTFLANEKYEQMLDYIATKIPNFGQRISRDFQNNLNKIKKGVLE